MDGKAWNYEMIGHSEKSVEAYCKPANVNKDKLRAFETPCIDDSQLSQADHEAVGELSAVAARIVLKALYVARLGRADCLWTINDLARKVTKWSKACDKRLYRLISYMWHTRNQVQHCYVSNEPEDCFIGVVVDASFAGDTQDSKSTSGCFACLFGSRTFVPLTWFCKKQACVSHSSKQKL